MKSKAAIKGHPIHPMLVSFPIGLFATSLVCDLIGLAAGSRKMKRTGYHLMLAGLAGGAAAAVPGVIDYLTVVPPDSDAETTAQKHALSNVAVMGLFGANAILRSQGMPVAASALLSAAACGLMTYAGWLGGNLVYLEQIGVEHLGPEESEHLSLASCEALAGDFVAVCRKGDLKNGQMALVTINGERIALARLDGDRYVAFADRCTHMGGPLSDGSLVGDRVMCPWHGSEFNVCTGAVECGPAREGIPTHEVQIDGEQVQIRAPRLTERSLLQAGSLG